jgi:hypothetical protein
VDSVFELASKVRRNIVAEMFEPKLEVSPRVLSIPVARISVNSCTCQKSQRGGGVSPTQRSEFIVVHFVPRPFA